LITNFRKCVGSGDGTTDGWIVRSDQALDGSHSVYLSRGSAVIGIVYRYSICCHFGKQAGVARVTGDVSGLGVGNDGVSQPSYLVIRRYAAPAQLPLAAGLLTLAGGVIGLSPIANRFVLSWGAAFTFAIGSFVLLGRQLFWWFNSRVVTPTQLY